MLTTLPLLIWRTLDLLLEMINGAVKMSMGDFVVVGNAATALQVLIIAALFFTASLVSYLLIVKSN